MSTELTNKVWANFPGGGSELAVLMGIAEACNSEGNCGLPLAKLAGFSPRHADQPPEAQPQHETRSCPGSSRERRCARRSESEAKAGEQNGEEFRWHCKDRE